MTTEGASRSSRARAGARRRARRPRAAEAGRRSLPRDRAAASAAAATIITLLLVHLLVLSPRGAAPWAGPTLVFCLLAAAAAGRALVGRHQIPPEADAPGERLLARVGWAAVVAAAVLPFLPTVTIGFLSDDYGLLSGIQQADGLWAAFSRRVFPLFFRPGFQATWWLAGRLWGDSPAGYHALNLASHGANALLVFALARRWTGSARGATLGALLFAVHPLHVEPVAWACALNDVLAATFVLASLLLLEVHLSAASPRGRTLALAGALSSFALAVLMKEAAVALPGLVVLRLALVPRERPGGMWALVGGYGATAAAYLLVRQQALGGLGGYPVRQDRWGLLPPHVPLMHTAAFLFPLHGGLFSAAPWWVLTASASAMGVGALWWVRGLPHAPARRLWMWLSWVFVMSLPVWALPAGTPELEHSRFAYLPTIGLALLFGDLCTGRGGGWRRSGAAAAATVAAAAGLSLWYVQPWRLAGDLAAAALREGQRVVAELPDSPAAPTVYFQGLPATHLGAQVFRNGYPQALARTAARPVMAHTVSHEGGSGLTPQVLAMSSLLPGEYVVAWQGESHTMEVVRVGGGRTGGRP